MRSNIKRLLRECRKRSSYDRGYKWEPGMDFNEAENKANFPFKPEGPRADKWGGDLGDWEDALAHAKPGTTIDFYITGQREGELVTNFYVRIKSKFKAECQDCGGKPFVVVVPLKLSGVLVECGPVTRGGFGCNMDADGKAVAS